MSFLTMCYSLCSDNLPCHFVFYSQTWNIHFPVSTSVRLITAGYNCNTSNSTVRLHRNCTIKNALERIAKTKQGRQQQINFRRQKEEQAAERQH